MSTFKKHLNKKIPSKLFYSILILFVLLVLLVLANIFYVKQISSAFIKSPNIGKIETRQTPAKTNINNSASISATKNPQSFKPPISGNQIKVPVLYYHYVGNNPNPADLQRNALSITPDKFAEQMKYLKDNGFTTISYDTLYATLKKQTTLPNKPIVLTFDDGYIDFYYNAYNILHQYGFSATVFVPTGLVGQSAYLTWDMIKEMHASGLISYGAHSIHHYHLTTLSPSDAILELTESKKALQDHLGININFMAYPYGDTNTSIISMVQKAGYVGAIGTWSSNIQSEGTIYNSPRLRVSGSIDIASFAQLLH